MATKENMPERVDNWLSLAVQVMSAVVSFNRVSEQEMEDGLKAVFEEIKILGGGGANETPDPAVPIKKSVTDDYIVCLEDGKKLRTLKRYLNTHYDLTPDAYRRRWALPVDYPMVAPSYAKLRSAFAKKAGLGRRPNARSKSGRSPRKTSDDR